MKKLAIVALFLVVLVSYLLSPFGKAVTPAEDKIVLAFGSCNNQYQPQKLWDDR